MPEAHTSNRLGELDALRGLAAVVVVLFHYTTQAPNVLPGVKTVSWHLAWGHFGVQLFFAISGFVIFMTLDRTRSAFDFAVSRFSRLYPVYWAGVAVTSLGVVLLGADSLRQSLLAIALNLTMLQSFFYLPSVDGAYWSLSVELAFYVCMLALWQLRLLPRIEAVLIGWIALKFVWHIVPVLPTRVAMLMALGYIQWFAIGIAAYRVREGKRRWIQQMPVLAAAFLATVYLGKPGEVPVFAVVTAIFALLVTQRLGWLNRKWLLWLGAVSYPLYIVHQNLGYAVMYRLQSLGISPLISTLVAVMVALSLAQAIHVLVEQPALERIRRAWKGRKAASLPQTASA